MALKRLFSGIGQLIYPFKKYNPLTLQPLVILRNVTVNAGGAYTFTIQRMTDPTVSKTVSWAIAGSSKNGATAADFGGTFPSGTVTFSPGQTTQTVTVTPVNAVLPE